MRLLLLVMILTLSACHVGRFFVYNFADYRDYKKFPVHEIHAPDETYEFERVTDTFDINYYPTESYNSFEEWMMDNKTLAFMVIQNDTIKYEWYRKGFDESSVFTSFSLVKSLVSLMTGVAVDEGKLNVNDPIGKYLPELRDSAVRRVKIEHLLNMQSGIKFQESYFNPFASIARLYYGRKILKYIRNLKLEGEPGQKFDYSSMDTQLLSLIVERATGVSISDYLEQKFWQPLQMKYDASWSLDSKKHDTEKGFSSLNARMIDYAKFGKLMLQKGKWEGKQLVSESWLEKSTAGSDAYAGYSYQWWINTYSPEKDYTAQGILGQYLYINENTNTIVVRFGKNWGEVSWKRLFHQISTNPVVLCRVSE